MHIFTHKKTILVMAALGAVATTAQAQSGVTLFGLIDVNISHYSAGDKTGVSSQTKMNDGTVNGLNGSRWGIRTQEDLGGGLKVGAHLESGFTADTGGSAQGGRLFGRQGFISLSSATAGELRLGRQYVLGDPVVGLSNSFGNALVSNPGSAVTNMGKNLPMYLNAPRADNILQYQTPAFSGLTAAAQFAPGEGTADNFGGLRLMYANAPLNVGISYEWNQSRSGAGKTNKSLALGANYDFGSFKLLGGLQRNNDLTTTSGNGAAVAVSNLTVTGDSTFTMKDTHGYTLGVEAPLGSATVVGVNYTRVNYESATGQSQNLGKLAFIARHGFSKTIFAYAGFSVATGDLKEYISEKSVAQAGLRMAF